MPIAVIRFQCSECLQEFHDEGGAKACEIRGFLDELIPMEAGQEIDFYREHKSADKSIPTYFKDRGTILHKNVTFNKKYMKHQHILICACKDDEGLDVERGVLLIIVATGDKDNPEKMMFSPDDMAYKKGFADILKKELK